MSTDLIYENIPGALRSLKSWMPCSREKKPILCYKTEADRQANLRTLDGWLASTTKHPAFQFYLTKASGYVFIDLDHVLDQQTGAFPDWVYDLVQKMDTYTETSISGKGLHLICKGVLPSDLLAISNLEEKMKLPPQARIEIHSGNSPRLFLMTGNIFDLQGTIQPRQEQASRLLQRVKELRDNNPVVKLEANISLEPVDWKKEFHTIDELADGDLEFLIDGILPKGVDFIGGLSGQGKTWFALSLSRAITTGNKLWSNFTVLEPRNILYLCPEMAEKAFKKRCVKFGINKERFRCRTISDGVPIALDNIALVDAIREWDHPIIILDTAIRFIGTDADENSASENARGLAKDIFALLHLGAAAVICLHHSPKATANTEELTLENVLRGTSDLGAICDCVWGVRFEHGNDANYTRESKKLVRLETVCVKARDFTEPDAVRLQLFPYLDEKKDFVMLEGTVEDCAAERENVQRDSLRKCIAENPKITYREIESKTGIALKRIRQEAESVGFKKLGDGWVPTGGVDNALPVF
jgi:hypothetical protein